MDNELEPHPAAQMNRGEVSNIARRDPRHAERLRERGDGRVHEPEAETLVAAIDLESAKEQRKCRCRVGEGSARDVSHKLGHRPTLAPQEIVHLGENKPGNVACARAVDRLPEGEVIGCARDEIVKQRPGVTDERRSAHGAITRGTAPSRPRAPADDAG